MARLSVHARPRPRPPRPLLHRRPLSVEAAAAVLVRRHCCATQQPTGCASHEDRVYEKLTFPLACGGRLQRLVPRSVDSLPRSACCSDALLSLHGVHRPGREEGWLRWHQAPIIIHCKVAARRWSACVVVRLSRVTSALLCRYGLRVCGLVEYEGPFDMDIAPEGVQAVCHVLCCAVLCCAVLCCAVLCCTRTSQQ